MLQFPYGIADFYSLIDEGYLYIDRTDRISVMEQLGKQLLLLRPRRFGKSLWLSVLENYYDLAKAEQFEHLFSQLAIGQQPTARHNKYFILRWDFSTVAAQGDADQISSALHQHLNGTIERFNAHYQQHLPHPISLHPENGLRSFDSLLATLQTTGHKLYLLIDEYDNFANEVMVSQLHGLDRYQALVHGEGLLKTVFKTIKAAAGTGGVDRVFITGVSPVVMSDVSSGYNVHRDISQRPELHDLCGFHEHEIAAILDAIAPECGFSAEQTNEALTMMRQFYNGYRFTDERDERIYNPTLALYFLDSWQRDCRSPRKILDDNLAMDRNRIHYVGQLPHGEDLITQALHPTKPLTISELANRFGVEDMLQAPKDANFLASLLYYFGVLTFAGRDQWGELELTIPNLVVRRLYVERIQEHLLPKYEDNEQRQSALKAFYSQGELEPLCELIEQKFLAVFDNRDLRWSNELVVKTAFLVVLFSETFYIMDSEPTIQRGYADLMLRLRPDMRQYQLFDHLLEFKILSLNDLKLTSKTLAAISRAELLALPLVQQKLTEAKQQLSRYRAVLEQTYGETIKLQTHAVVCINLERLVWG